MSNYIVGNAYDNGLMEVVQYHNFFTFDLTGIGPVSDAVLRVFLIDFELQGLGSYESPDPSEIFTLFDISTPLPDLTAGTAGIPAFDDLGTGQVFGAVEVSAADRGSYVEVALNGNALASIVAANGPWGIGAG